VTMLSELQRYAADLDWQGLVRDADGIWFAEEARLSICDPAALARGFNNLNPHYIRPAPRSSSAPWSCSYCGGLRAAEAMTCSGCGAARSE